MIDWGNVTQCNIASHYQLHYKDRLRNTLSMQGKKSFISAKNKPEALTVPIHNISSSQQIMQTISLEKQFNLNCISKEKIRFQTNPQSFNIRPLHKN